MFASSGSIQVKHSLLIIRLLLANLRRTHLEMEQFNLELAEINARLEEVNRQKRLSRLEQSLNNY